MSDDDNEPTIFEQHGIKPGDPVPLHVANQQAFARDRDYTRRAQIIGRETGKVITNEILEKQGVKVNPTKRKKPAQNRPAPKDPAA